MRKVFVKIVQILDGTPAIYGKRQAGQSVVELALITPILIILLAGLVEIGWFANNYLSLLDVTRAGARRATVLQDQQSPLFWDNKYTYVPNAELSVPYQMHYDGTNGSDPERYMYRWGPTQDVVTGNPGPYACDPRYTTRFFYNEVICTMIASMDPLVLNPSNGIDDIIVSGFSLQLVDPSSHPSWLSPLARAIPQDVPQIVVVGRYPTNANECDVQVINGVDTVSPLEGRDPFDFNGNGRRDMTAADDPTGVLHDDFTELPGYDAMASNPRDAEKQVGFSLFGNHKIPNTECVGSEWTMLKVEQLFNLPDFNMNNNTTRDYLPSQGMALVEMYWEHEMLLKIPVLSPVFTVVGNPDGKMVINVWAAFPLPSVEPDIIFP